MTESLGRSNGRWHGLVVLQVGVAMVVVDGTIVDVALGSIKADLGFSDASLVWIVNAYLLTFSGFLLLAGKLGDFFGHRRIFLLGNAIFALASLLCGIAHWQAMLIGARALQGLGAAIISAVSLSLTLTLFPDGPERAKAIAIAGVIAASGGCLGLLLGGALTSLFGWHWIFLLNVPVGFIICMLGVTVLPDEHERERDERIHVGAALTLTTALMLAMYAILGGNKFGWSSIKTVAPFAGAATLLLTFIYRETQSPTPMVPLGLLRHRNFRVAIIALALLATSLAASYFFITLYLQLILKWSSLNVGLAFLPSNVAMMALSLGPAAKLVSRFGIKVPLATGLLLTTAGLVLFAQVPFNGELTTDILPGMILLGFGSNIASISLFLSAIAPVSPANSGLASGLLNTTVTMGGTLGLTILVSLAEARTNEMLASGNALPIALHGGYHLALLFGAGISAATLTSVALLRS